MEGPPLGRGGEDITWPDQVAPRGRKASCTRKIKPQTSNLSALATLHLVATKSGLTTADCTQICFSEASACKGHSTQTVSPRGGGGLFLANHASLVQPLECVLHGSDREKTSGSPSLTQSASSQRGGCCCPCKGEYMHGCSTLVRFGPKSEQLLQKMDAAPYLGQVVISCIFLVGVQKS